MLSEITMFHVCHGHRGNNNNNNVGGSCIDQKGQWVLDSQHVIHLHLQNDFSV